MVPEEAEAGASRADSLSKEETVIGNVTCRLHFISRKNCPIFVLIIFIML